MKRCPKCGCEEFYINAHVVEEWRVDKNGEFIALSESCLDVIYEATDIDDWECAKCRHVAAGYEFEIKEEE